MADYEGYLLLHDIGRQADPLYFELEGGLLRYYDKKDGRFIGQFSLTRHRVSAQPLDGGLTPTASASSSLDKHFRRTRIVLGASTPETQDQWIHALRTWRRRNWKDTAVIAAFDDEAKALRMVMIMYHLELKLLRFTDLTLRKVNMDPQSSDPIYGDAVFTKHQAHPTALVPGAIQVTRYTNTFGFQGVYANQFAL
ncbi:PH domain-like [Phytophthora cactorum]|nr:PH domain-like [Phytophthora cactorum]